MNKELAKRLSGLSLLVLAAVLTVFLQGVGEAERPKTYQVTFERGTRLNDAAPSTLGRVLEDALTRGDAQVIVAGHTGTRGDAEANQALAEQRAETVAEYLIEAGLDKTRIESLGVGGSQPLTQKPDESDRAFQRRLSRAEITVAP